MSQYTNFQQEFAELFGELNTRQLWAIVKLCKDVRLRRRSNTAFNNQMNATFPYAKFSQVTKTKPDGTTYPGLQITVANEAQQNVPHNYNDEDQD